MCCGVEMFSFGKFFMENNNNLEKKLMEIKAVLYKADPEDTDVLTMANLVGIAENLVDECLFIVREQLI